MTRVFIAGIFHETHSFTGDTTGLEGFVIHRGAEILARRGDASQMDGFLSAWPNAKAGRWCPAPSIPAARRGTVDHAVFETFWSEVKPVLEKALAEGLDAIHLSLHGAMVTSACDDPEGELMARIRATPGAENLPMYCVGDLHGTMTPQDGRAVGLHDLLPRMPAHRRSSTARCCPPNLLARCLKTGVRPKHLVLVTPIVWPPTGTGTRDGPMRALEDAARRMEKEIPGVLAVNIVGGYAFSDVPYAGVAFSIITEGDEAAAQEGLRELAQIAWDMREGGIPKQHDLDHGGARIQGQQLQFGGKGPVLLVEPSDNIGGGAPGDGTDVMRALLKYDMQGAGVAIADAESVAALQMFPSAARSPCPSAARAARSIRGR